MNWVLVGMPGCGKTSLGKYVSEKLHINFIDLDELIEKEHGNINKIFENEGEEAFRKYETSALNSALKNANTIISSGGGIIEKSENLKLLKKTQVIFIDREVENILKDVDKDTRPLLKSGKNALLKLYEKRYQKYLDIMNYHIKNNTTFEECAQKIELIIKKK